MKKLIKHASPLSKAHLGIFILVFAVIGAIAIWRSFAAPNPNLPGDLNNDNTVNVTDLSILLSNYGSTNTTADINSDGQVNVLDLSILLSHYGQSTTITTAITASTASHNIDGNLSESDWNISTPVTKCVIGTCNNTVTFGTLWDNSYIYVGVKVLDSSLKNDSSNCWDDDSVEVYIDPTNAGGTTYTANDRQIVQRYNDAGLCTGVGSNTGVLHAVTPITGGYSVELAIPWSLLGTTASSGKTIGFDVGVNDDDDGTTRDSQLIYNGTASNSTDPSGFAKLSLTGTPTGGPPSGGGGTPPPTSLLFYSNNVSGWGSSSEDDAKALGVAGERQEFAYTSTPSNYDGAFSAMASRGISILPLINGSGTYPSDQATFASFTAAFVKRFGPGGDFWKANTSLNGNLAPVYFELWNEPYGNWKGTPCASCYVSAVKAAVNAGRASNPSAKYLISAQYETWYPEVQTWIDDMYTAAPDLNNYFDGIAVHPYSNPDSVGPLSTGSDDFQGTMDTVHQKMLNHGAGSKVTYITEMGWATCPADPTQCVDEATQATYVGQLVDLLKSPKYSYVNALVYYEQHDYTGATNDREPYFGLLRVDGSRKPAWQTYYNKIHGL